MDQDPSEVHHFTTIKGPEIVLDLTKVCVFYQQPHPGILKVAAVPLGPVAVNYPFPQLEGILIQVGNLGKGVLPQKQ